MAREVLYGVDVQVTGYTPLLMHKMSVDALGPKPKAADTDYSMEWISTCYTDGDGKTLVCPASNLESMLIAVSSGKKVRKTPVAKLVTQLDFDEMEYPITIEGKPVTTDTIKKNNWVDVRGVVIQRQRVARCRARLPSGWSFGFHIDSRTSLITPEYLRTLIEEAGELVGLMDYRPQRKGKFGQFEVTSYKVS